MDELENDRRLPPYVSFKSFRKLTDGLKDLMPGRLDRSYMLAAKFNGSTATALLTACRFLGLVSGVEPTDTLRIWVKQEGDEGKKTFEKILRATYVPIFEMDLQAATAQMLREKFRKTYGAEGEVGDKCIVFFTQACERAGIGLSRLITKKTRTARSGRTQMRKRKLETFTTDGNIPTATDEEELHPQVPGTPSEVEWAKFKTLVEKFPTFDPAWPDELKTRWFAAYEAFMMTNIGGKR